ncbi:thioesterase II family protein [Streptomyces sp. NPDC020983]|uniref:thioesterase II family protein n=1 Tax=Streptomyces sp. NPDC020983 TaxID=3365106 RepID=UPI0037B3FCCC
MTDIDSGSWVRSYRPASGGVRLFCFPHAGGSASYFYPWSRSLRDVEVLALQYPGRQDRGAEPYLRNVPELADRIHEALAPQLDEPYAFFGHSMGAVLAFEVAARVARDGLPGPVHLFASGRRAPSRTRYEDLHRASTATLVAEMRALGGTDPRVLADPDLLELVLPTVRADYTAVETYRYAPTPPLSCDVTVLIGDTDPKVNLDDAQAWAQHTRGRFCLRTFPGGHFYLEECQAGVLDVITSAL